MKREEAIKRLESHTQYFVPVDDLDVFDMAISALREQEKLESNLKVLESSGWISVEERLPEVERSYLTYTDKGRIIIDSFCIYPEYGTKFWFDGNGKVTHWMPLPEPPKEEA